MLSWLRADLAASRHRWKIVFFHHPPYSSTERGQNLGVRRQLLPILEANGVDLVLTGHDHNYERTIPLWQGEDGSDNPAAITYLIAGGGGAPLRRATPQWWTAAAESRRRSFLSLTIEGCTLTGAAHAADGEQIDSFRLDRCDESGVDR